MKKQGLIKIESLPPGPDISGMVTVPLAELDKMRVDHGRLRALAEELQANQKMVIVRVDEKYQEYEDSTNPYREGKWVDRYRAISQEYRNLDDVMVVLKKEISQEYLNRAEKAEKELSQIKGYLSEQKVESELKRTELKEKTQRLEELEENEKALAEQLISTQKLTEGINARLAEVLKELETEKHKKGFWSFLG